MISVALPVVKTKFLRYALESILNQSYHDFELIVVNNGSPEDVDEILKDYKDPRIIYIKHEKMLPIIENWNRCLSYAKGEYFVLFSDDDIYEKDFLKEMTTLARKYTDVDIFHVRVKVIDENNNIAYYTASCPEYETVAEFIWHRLKSYRMHYAPDFMCRTETLRRVGGFVDFPNAWGSDDATWISVANENGIVASSKALCNWRQSGMNLSRRGSVSIKLEAVKAYTNWLIYFIENKLQIQENERELLKEIKRIISQRMNTQQGIALKLGVTNKGNRYFQVLFNWIKYRKKYSLKLFSLIWGIMLIIKDSKKNDSGY